MQPDIIVPGDHGDHPRHHAIGLAAADDKGVAAALLPCNLGDLLRHVQVGHGLVHGRQLVAVDRVRDALDPPHAAKQEKRTSVNGTPDATRTLPFSV